MWPIGIIFSDKSYLALDTIQAVRAAHAMLMQLRIAMVSGEHSKQKRKAKNSARKCSKKTGHK